MQAMVLDYVKVCYDNKTILNISSLTKVVNKYIVTNDSHKNDDFNVHANIGIMEFRRNKQGLYYCFMR